MEATRRRVEFPPLPCDVTEVAGTTVSLYSGAGGLDIGFAAAGFQPIWANDIDPLAVATYNKLFDRDHAHAGDIREQDVPGEGAADLVVGGPPCQGFSVAGKMDPDDPRSRHVWDFLSVVQRVKPRAWCMENVKALAENRRWSGLLKSLIAAGEEIGDGYEVSLLVLNASHYGVPQARERMFLIGMGNGAVIDDPPPTTKSAPPTVGEVLAMLPRYGEPGNDTLCPARVTTARKPVLRLSPYAGMLFNGQGRPLNLNAPAPTLPASMGGNRTPIIDQDELDHGSDPWVVGYHHRLWTERKDPLRRVPRRLRRLTVEEAAAIQTFPLGMDFEGTLGQQFRQIGNAVPPTLAYHVATAIRRGLEQDGAAHDLAAEELELVA